MQKKEDMKSNVKNNDITAITISEGGDDSDSGVVLCDSEFSECDATIEFSDAAIEDLTETNIRVSNKEEINMRVNKEGTKSSMKDLIGVERDQNHQSLVKRVQLNHRSI